MVECQRYNEIRAIMLHATVYQIGTLPTSDFHINIINFRIIITVQNTYYIHYCFVVCTAPHAQ